LPARSLFVGIAAKQPDRHQSEQTKARNTQKPFGWNCFLRACLKLVDGEIVVRGRRNERVLVCVNGETLGLLMPAGPPCRCRVKTGGANYRNGKENDRLNYLLRVEPDKHAWN
jgi:hypothetical protein